MSSTEATNLYTDGACSGNPGPGGWGWVTEAGLEGNGGAEHTTNQRMEVQAVLEGLKKIEGTVNVVSDSTYVVKCFNDRWYEGWKKRGWKNSQRKPVANRDLWEPLIALYLERQHELTFTWVKGHSGNHYNEIADQLAVAARDVQMGAKQSAAGSGPSGDAPVLDPTVCPWPPERALWVIGATELSKNVDDKLVQTIAGLDPERDIVVSGLRRGAELRAAELAIRAGVPLAVVLPFADPARNWPPELRDRFGRAAEGATWQVTLGGSENLSGKAIEKRNEWLHQAVVGAIVVNDPAMAESFDAFGLSVVEVLPD